MSPHITIITTAMSLGGMASVGFNHFGEVEKQVSEFHSQKEEKVKEVEISQVGERVEKAFAETVESMRNDFAKEREVYSQALKEQTLEIEMMKSRQNSYEILMEHLQQEQTSLGFIIETQSKSFVPLRSAGSRFTRVKSENENGLHPLLPPVTSSWTSDY